MSPVRFLEAYYFKKEVVNFSIEEKKTIPCAFNPGQTANGYQGCWSCLANIFLNQIGASAPFRYREELFFRGVKQRTRTAV